MHTRCSTKYLLLSALALAVIVCDVYFGRDNSDYSVQASDAAIEATPAPLPLSCPQVASLSSSAVELTEPVPVEKSQLAETLAATSDNLAEKLKSIEADYQTMAQPILAQSAPIIGAEERTKLAFLDQEKLADVGKVLSTDELEIYQNKTAPDAAPRRR